MKTLIISILAILSVDRSYAESISENSTILQNFEAKEITCTRGFGTGYDSPLDMEFNPSSSLKTKIKRSTKLILEVCNTETVPCIDFIKILETPIVTDPVSNEVTTYTSDDIANGMLGFHYVDQNPIDAVTLSFRIVGSTLKPDGSCPIGFAKQKCFWKTTLATGDAKSALLLCR